MRIRRWGSQYLKAHSDGAPTVTFDDRLTMAAYRYSHFQWNLELISSAQALFDLAAFALLDKIGFDAVIQHQWVAELPVTIFIGTATHQINAGWRIL